MITHCKRSGITVYFKFKQKSHSHNFQITNTPGNILQKNTEGKKERKTETNYQRENPKQLKEIHFSASKSNRRILKGHETMINSQNLEKYLMGNFNLHRLKPSHIQYKSCKTFYRLQWNPDIPIIQVSKLLDRRKKQ